MEEKTWTKQFTSLISKNDKRRECQQETHQIHQVYQTGIRPTVPLVVGPVTAVRLPRKSLPKIWAENCNTCSPAMNYWHLNISCTLRIQVLVFPVNGLLFYVCHTLGWPPLWALCSSRPLSRSMSSSFFPAIWENHGMVTVGDSYKKTWTMQDHCCNFQHKNTQIFDFCFIDLHGTLQPISRQRASSLEAEISSLRKMLCNESFSDSGFQEQTQELN